MSLGFEIPEFSGKTRESAAGGWDQVVYLLVSLDSSNHTQGGSVTPTSQAQGWTLGLLRTGGTPRPRGPLVRAARARAPRQGWGCGGVEPARRPAGNHSQGPSRSPGFRSVQRRLPEGGHFYPHGASYSSSQETDVYQAGTLI